MIASIDIIIIYEEPYYKLTQPTAIRVRTDPSKKVLQNIQYRYNKKCVETDSILMQIYKYWGECHH